MVDFKDKFKSFVDKAQQKITEIQNDEKLLELIEQGKEKIENFNSSNQKHSLAREESHLYLSSSGYTTINLTSNSANPQVGESKWTPSLG